MKAYTLITKAKRHWPVIILHLVLLLIFSTNIHPDKWFLGWDSLNPEFNTPLNINRAVNASWQGNYGLGTLTGHGFGATLVHSITVWVLSFILPMNLIRQVVTLLCLYAGSIGTYFLICYIFARHIKTKTLGIDQIRWVALFGALFYTLNVGTAQQFYLQLEAFIIHFAGLPWFLLYIYKILGEKKNIISLLLGFSLINLLSSAQGFIPPLFITLLIFVEGICILEIITAQNVIFVIRRAALINIVIIAINLFWLLPFLYYSISRSGVYLNSYINILTTPEFVEKSLKYGDLANTSLLKSFFFDSLQTDGYALSPWINHLSNPLVLLIGYSLFTLSIVGLIWAFWKKEYKLWGLGIATLLVFSFLSSNTEPFKSFNGILRAISPLFYQSFRIAFTKTSIAIALAISIFASYFLLQVGYFVHRNLRRSVIFVPLVAIIILGFPAIQGNLVYKKLLVKLPSAYIHTINELNKAPYGRIMMLPEDCAEGWYSQNWGYFGSGFYWYAVNKPMLSRSFDVWSQYNESYYWQLISALRSGNYNKLAKIIEKYNIRYILYDKNTLHCRGEKGFDHLDNLDAWLKSNSNLYLRKSFKNEVEKTVDIWEVASYSSPVSIINNPFVIYTDEPTMLNYPEDDPYFNNLGQYISTSSKDTNTNFTLAPFANINTKRPSANGFTVKQDSIIFDKKNLDILSKRANIYTPSYKDSMSMVPGYINLIHDPLNGTFLDIKFKTIKLIANGKAYQDSLETKISLEDTIGLKKILINEQEYSIDKIKDHDVIHLFPPSQTSYIIAEYSDGLREIIWKSNEDPNFESITDRNLTIPLQDSYLNISVQYDISSNQDVYSYSWDMNPSSLRHLPCNNPDNKAGVYEFGKDEHSSFLDLIDSESSSCINFTLNGFDNGLSYIYTIDNKHIAGPDNIRIISKDYKGSINFEGYLNVDSNIVIFPEFVDRLGNTVTLQNTSKIKEKSINRVYGVKASYFPINLIRNIMILDNLNNESSITPLEGKHINETKIQTNITSNVTDLKNNSYIVINESYDEGWVAYETDNVWFPFFGKRLTDHMLVNNWANAWRIEDSPKSADQTIHEPSADSSEKAKDELRRGWRLPNYPLHPTPYTLVIVFWPQYLQYLGFFILGITITTLVLLAWRNHKASKS